jgi:hypothetical protein
LAEPLCLDDFEMVGRHPFAAFEVSQEGCQNVAVGISDEQFHRGGHALKLTGDFGPAWSHLRVSFKEPRRVNHRVEQITAWMYGSPGFNGKVHLALIDATGETFAYTLTLGPDDRTGAGTVDWEGWRKVDASIEAIFEASGGNANGIIELPCFIQNLSVWNRTAGGALTLYIDDLCVE